MKERNRSASKAYLKRKESGILLGSLHNLYFLLVLLVAAVTRDEWRWWWGDFKEHWNYI